MTNRDEYRIKNIPNFYRDLDAIGPLRYVDKNDPRIQGLRKKLGVELIMTSKTWYGDYYKK